MAYYCYITFPTTFFAIRSESMLKNKSCSFKMVPVPRSISSSCGTALRCDCNELAAINKILQNNKIGIEGFYRLEEISFRTLSVEELFLDE